MVETVVALSLGTKYLLDPAALRRIRDILGAGGLVVHPTDTVYGLAADPFQAGAVEKLYLAKARPRDLPVSISVADVEDVFRFGQRTA
ncbi:MAG TPA: Sua5/YciO/YrdC/YwlC family protein, partial [Thermoplasmata archaeon]|nr:Sua5/YciO/YrdC/YwlC family protein [Thermoplasmata archaeon]